MTGEEQAKTPKSNNAGRFIHMEATPERSHNRALERYMKNDNSLTLGNGQHVQGLLAGNTGAITGAGES